jgi:excisionase family DNA binding protein
MTSDQLLTVAEVAERLRLHPITVRRHITAGRLPAVRIGRSVRVPASAVEALVGQPPVSDLRAAYRAEPAVGKGRAMRRLGPVTKEERRRRRRLFEQARALRAQQPPLRMSTAEVVHLARTARDWMYRDNDNGSPAGRVALPLASCRAASRISLRCRSTSGATLAG